MKLTKLNDVYKNWMTGDGVFTDLNSFDVPWKLENNVSSLNMAYHGSHSGDKNISPVVHKFLTSEDAQTRAKLASIIFTMFADKWARLWSALEIEYNPLQNYNMTESETTNEVTDNDQTHTGTDTTQMTGTDTVANSGTDTTTHTGTDTTANSGTDTTTRTGTDTVANSGTDTTTHTGTDTTVDSGSDSTTHTGTNTVIHTGSNENEVSAFNSSSYQDNQKNTIDTEDEETRDTEDETTYGKHETETVNLSDATLHGKTETETRNMTDTVTHNTADTTDQTRDIERELTRSGNIGVTTSQQMLQSEIELRKWLYYQSVFNDIDTILTLSIY